LKNWGGGRWAVWRKGVGEKARGNRSKATYHSTSAEEDSGKGVQRDGHDLRDKRRKEGQDANAADNDAKPAGKGRVASRHGHGAEHLISDHGGREGEDGESHQELDMVSWRPGWRAEGSGGRTWRARRPRGTARCIVMQRFASRLQGGRRGSWSMLQSRGGSSLFISGRKGETSCSAPVTWEGSYKAIAHLCTRPLGQASRLLPWPVVGWHVNILPSCPMRLPKGPLCPTGCDPWRCSMDTVRRAFCGHRILAAVLCNRTGAGRAVRDPEGSRADAERQIGAV
jgi:hypothetical protein